MWGQTEPIRYQRQWKFIRIGRHDYGHGDSMMKVRWENGKVKRAEDDGFPAQKADLAIIVFSACPVCGESYEEELKWYTWFKERKFAAFVPFVALF